jgi:hypothetical protein
VSWRQKDLWQRTAETRSLRICDQRNVSTRSTLGASCRNSCALFRQMHDALRANEWPSSIDFGSNRRSHSRQPRSMSVCRATIVKIDRGVERKPGVARTVARVVVDRKGRVEALLFSAPSPVDLCFGRIGSVQG